jgi:hypothetical protein
MVPQWGTRGRRILGTAPWAAVPGAAQLAASAGGGARVEWTHARPRR